MSEPTRQQVEALAAMDPNKPMPVWAQKLGVHVARAWVDQEIQRTTWTEADDLRPDPKPAYLEITDNMVERATMAIHWQRGQQKLGAIVESHLCRALARAALQAALGRNDE